jgi:hypothetical protein
LYCLQLQLRVQTLRQEFSVASQSARWYATFVVASRFARWFATFVVASQFALRLVKFRTANQFARWFATFVAVSQFVLFCEECLVAIEAVDAALKALPFKAKQLTKA